VILNIGGNAQESAKIADILQEIAKREYYRKKEGESLNISKNFESTLNKINQAFAALAESGHVEWVNKLHLGLVAIYNHQIQFTHTGNIKILLLRDKILINLIQKSKTEQTPIKIFSNIVSGSLQKNDKLFFATDEFFDYLSEDNLKKIIFNSSPDEACTKLQNVLSSQGKGVSPISVIFAEISPETDAAISKKHKTNETSRMVSIYPDLDDLNSLEKPENIFPKNNKIENKTNVWINKIFGFFVIGFSKIKKLFNKLLLRLKNKGQAEIEEKETDSTRPTDENSKFASSPKNIKNKLQYFSQNLIKKFNKLPRTSKIFFVASCILVVAFLASTLHQADKRSATKKSNRFEQLLNEAYEKEKMASDALIYQDFNKAKDFLVEARSILENETIKSNKEKRGDVDLLNNKINEQFDKVDKIIRVQEPILLAESTAKIGRLLGLDESIYMYDPETNTIFELNEEAKKIRTISSESKNIGYFKNAAANLTKKSLIFLTDTPEVAEFDLSKKEIENLDITFANDDQEIKEINLYNDRLYLLDSKSNQIFKHTRTISGYSKGIGWIKEGDVDLKNAASFAIDGEIYILNQDGSVLKFSNGVKEEFTLASPSKPLDSPTKIFTLTDQNFLYILDPKNNRVVVFDKKSGELKNQYISDAFVDLKDTHVNEEAGKIYLLCGQKIFGTSLEK
jgi:serine/threonine protein phosphatase PrpC